MSPASIAAEEDRAAPADPEVIAEDIRIPVGDKTGQVIQVLTWRHAVRRPYWTCFPIHGIGTGAWIWNGVASQLVRQGARVIAPTLPGHPPSVGGEKPRTIRFGDCLQAVRLVADRFLKGNNNVVVGHSLGAPLAARIANRRKSVSHLVLLSPIPANGIFRSCFRGASKYPKLMWDLLRQRSLLPFVNSSIQTARELYFGSPRSFPEALIGRCRRGFCPGPFYALWDLLFFAGYRVRPKGRTLIIAGAEDGLFSVEGLRQTAAAIWADFRILPVGHQMVLSAESAGQVAQAIDVFRTTAEGAGLSR